MSNIRVQGNPSGTGTLTIASPNTNSDFTLNLPANAGTIPVLTSVNNNGVIFVNSSGQATTGSALTFDGANLGVGTASPGARLQVEAAAGSGGGDVAIRLRDSTSTNTLQMIRTGATYSYGGMGGNEGALYSANTLTLCADSSGPIKFATNGSEQMRLTSTGLGIGTSSPSFPLDVAGAARSNSWIARANTSAPTADAFIYRPADNTLGFGTANTERARITSAGNFGVGTTAPAYRCVVQDSAGETIFGINNTSSGGRHYLLISGGSGGSYAGGRFGLYSVTNGIDLFAATTSTASTAGGTTGNGAGFANAGLWFDRGWGDYPSISVCSNNYAGNTNQSQLRIHGTNTTWYTYPSASGSDFSCSLFIDGTYQTGSDRRFKTNITEIDNALEKVLSMTGKRFQTVNRIGEVETNASQNGFRFGFIAQDLQAAGLDELYKHNVDEDDGTDGFNKAYCVEYDAVAPLLVNAIKEQQDIITALTARIAALEAK